MACRAQEFRIQNRKQQIPRESIKKIAISAPDPETLTFANRRGKGKKRALFGTFGTLSACEPQLPFAAVRGCDPQLDILAQIAQRLQQAIRGELTGLAPE